MWTPGPPDEARRREPLRSARGLVALLAILAGLVAPGAWAAGPLVWDEDGDGIDDRIGIVQLLGYRYSFEDADTLGRQRFEVIRQASDLIFGAYVRYSEAPDAADLAALTLIGVQVRHRLLALPALRVRATAAQVQVISALPGVERIEVVPLQYGSTRDGVGAIGAREASGTIEPDLGSLAPTADGRGIVVAILDSGINDGPVGAFPGHEALSGRGVGGASFVTGDSLLDTHRDQSVDPSDPGIGVGSGHGTHIASIVLGSGGTSGFSRGVAPAARFVDVRVLGTAGSGTGLPEALDWCLANRTRDWGSADTTYRGIDVINLSLSSLDRSDGRDLASALCVRLAQAGVVVVAAMGNDGLSGHVPSPAASDGAIAVGAIDIQRTAQAADDLAVDWDNTGPRADDGDTDLLEELKPLVLAPAVGVLAADGDATGDGQGYARRSGTSQAAAFTSGAVACLRSAYPGLSPGSIAAVLRATARRNGPGVPAGAVGTDPRWAAARGFGVLDLAAAVTELTDSTHTQVRRLRISGAGSTIAAVLTTMREHAVQHLVFERASDVNGVPGSYAPVDSVVATGDPGLADGSDCSVYSRTWPVPPAEFGSARWYRVAWSEAGVRRTATPMRVLAPTGPPAATARITVVHDALDTDLGISLRAGGGAFEQLLPGSSAAVETDWVDGISTTGTIAWTFEVDVPSGAADAWLPPTAAAPWELRVTDDGFVNRSGRISAFQLVWHSPSGDITCTSTEVPRPTLEGGAVVSHVPSPTAGVPVSAARLARVQPNPARAGAAITFSLPAGEAEVVRIHDLSGRLRAEFACPASAAAREAVWAARDAAGGRWPAGVYLARSSGGLRARLVLLAP